VSLSSCMASVAVEKRGRGPQRARPAAAALPPAAPPCTCSACMACCVDPAGTGRTLGCLTILWVMAAPSSPVHTVCSCPLVTLFSSAFTTAGSAFTVGAAQPTAGTQVGRGTPAAGVRRRSPVRAAGSWAEEWHGAACRCAAHLLPGSPGTTPPAGLAACYPHVLSLSSVRWAAGVAVDQSAE